MSCPRRCFYLFHVCRDITKLARVIRKATRDQYFSFLLWFFPHCCFALQSWRSLTKSTCTSWGYHRRTDVDMAVWTPLVQFQPVLVFLQGILVQEESKKQEIRGALTREQLWAFTLIREHPFSTVRHQTPRCHHLEAIHVGFFFTAFDKTPMQVHIERLFSLTQWTVQTAHFAHSGGW